MAKYFMYTDHDLYLIIYLVALTRRVAPGLFTTSARQEAPLQAISS